MQDPDLNPLLLALHAKSKNRGMFETQKSGEKTSSGEIGLNIRTLASPNVGQDQVSGGVSIPCRHATPVADALMEIYINFGEKLSHRKVS